MIRYDPATGSHQFQHGDQWRTLTDPHGPATARQLLRLNREGLLELRTTPGEPLTKLDTAHAIDQAQTGGRRANLDAAGGASPPLGTREKRSARGVGVGSSGGSSTATAPSRSFSPREFFGRVSADGVRHNPTNKEIKWL